MRNLVSKIEKMKPFFEKISNNPYLRAIRDGFISLIPIILFSSLFLLVAFVPNIFGFYWSTEVENTLMKAYDYSMGILALLMSATIAKSLTDNFNGKLPKLNQINSVSTMLASIICFLLVAVNPIAGGIELLYMGTRGLLTSFVVGFTVPNIYKFCIKNNITIKMPEEVPANISQTFKDLIPITISITLFWIFDIVFRIIFGVNFAEWIIVLFQPIFSAADGYVGLAIIFGVMAFFWFVGIHGPSIVEPAVAVIYITNVEMNFALTQQGYQATNVLAQGTQYFVATLGGVGATLVITFMFAFLAKSKQLRSVGKSATIPVIFGVNEPVLFGAPLVLNPVFFIPFILAPIANVWLFKFFIDFLGMNGFIYNLPWTTPGPIGLIMGTGFALLSIVLILVIIVVDFLIYYPFFKAYDNDLCLQEASRQSIEPVEEVTSQQINISKEISSEKNVMVLCANGATSSMLANAINKGAKEANISIQSTAMAYGQHKDLMQDFHIIILAPQMASMLSELKNDAEAYNIVTLSTSGAEYVKLSRTPSEAIKFVLNNLDKE